MVNRNGRHVVPDPADRRQLLDLGYSRQALDDRRPCLGFDLQRAQCPDATRLGTLPESQTVAFDDARFLQARNPGHDRSAGNAQLLRQRRRGHAGVGLQQHEQPSVEIVSLISHVIITKNLVNMTILRHLLTK